jgi:DNA-binding transcriptional LysR family regulator
VRLSPAGKQLAQIAQEHFQSLLQFKENIHKEPNEFRLGAEDGLLQRLVIPVVGSMRRADHSFRLSVQSHQTADTVSMLLAQRLDFGLIEAKAAPAALKRILVHTLTPAVVVPERIVPQRGLLTLKTALFDCPHAVVGSDDQLVQIINELAREMSKQFRPELVCDSVAQCMTAVRSGYYAALLPLQLWVPDSRFPCHVVEDSFLDGLKQSIALVWHPRLIDVSGRAAIRIKDALVAAVRGFSAAP